MRHLRINSIIAIALVSSIFTEEAAWAAGGLDNCHCEGKARSNPGDCLAPATEMDVDVEASTENASPTQGQDLGVAFGAAFYIPGAEVVEEFLALLADNPQLWRIPSTAFIMGFFCFSIYTWINKLFSKRPRSNFIVKVLLLGTFLPILSLIRAIEEEGWWIIEGLPYRYKLVLLMSGLAVGAYLRYTMGELYGWVAGKVRRARPEAEDIDLRLEGWGSGVNSVILDKEMKGVNWVDIPDAEGGQLRVLALGFSKSEMKEWAGRLLNAFEKKGHKVKRVIIYKLEDAVLLETHTAISDFKPHVVLIPHSLDTRPLVQFLRSVARRALEARARDERKGSILLEYETRNPWDIYIPEAIRRGLEGKEPHPSSDPLEAFRAAGSEFANHFNTYLYYHSIPKMLKFFLSSRAGKFNVSLGERLAPRIRSILIAYSNAFTGAERVRTWGQGRRSDLTRLGLFALRFRATRIVAKQANQGPGDGEKAEKGSAPFFSKKGADPFSAVRRIGGTLESRRIEMESLGHSALASYFLAPQSDMADYRELDALVEELTAWWNEAKREEAARINPEDFEEFERSLARYKELRAEFRAPKEVVRLEAHTIMQHLFYDIVFQWRHGPFKIRCKAAAFYGRMHGIEPYPEISLHIRLLKGFDDPEVRRLCAWILREAARTDESLLSHLEDMMNDPDASVRSGVLDAFVYLYLHLDEGDPLNERLKANIARFLDDSGEVQTQARAYTEAIDDMEKEEGPQNLAKLPGLIGAIELFKTGSKKGELSLPSWEWVAIGALGLFAAMFVPYFALKVRRAKGGNPAVSLSNPFADEIDRLSVEELKGQARRDMLRKVLGGLIDIRPYKALRVSYALNPQTKIEASMTYFSLADGKLQIGEFVFEPSKNEADDRLIEALKKKLAAHLIGGLMRLNPETAIQGSASDPARREIFEQAGMRPSASDSILYVGDARDRTFTLRGEAALQRGI